MNNGKKYIIPGIVGLNESTGITVHSCGATNVHNPELAYGTMTDQEGNIYRTVKIGNQTWMAENLRATKYRNGIPIPFITNTTQWLNDTIGAFSNFNNNSTFDCPYGKLYNWYAVTNSNQICPLNWHVPTVAEWTILENFLGGYRLSGAKLRSAGIQYWSSPNTGANNNSGFSGIPGGYVKGSGSNYPSIGEFGSWWSSSVQFLQPTAAWYFALYNNTDVAARTFTTKNYGFSVRCIKDVIITNNTSNLASLTTLTVGNISSNSATGGGFIKNDGGSKITQVGICWSTFPNPTTANNLVSATFGSLNYLGNISNLAANTKYYVRAYAINSSGTAYGNQEIFTTLQTSSNTGMITDASGNIYPTVTIGTQVWMAESLRTTKYRDGSNIPVVTDTTQWANNFINNTTLPMMCWYNNDSAIYTDNKFGALYNWYAINSATNGNKNVCPIGWHVPSDVDWNVLVGSLDPSYNPIGLTDHSIKAGGLMKSMGTQYWNFPNEGATNNSGFFGLPASARSQYGLFGNLGDFGYWYSSTETNTLSAWSRFLNKDGSNVTRVPYPKGTGLSVRCVKD